MNAVSNAALERLEAAAYRVPTDAPEADGTYAWDSTTMVLVRAHAGGQAGIGYSYTDASAGPLICGLLARTMRGRDVMAVPAAWEAMVRAMRNVGRPGLCATAISAVDFALWDLKARLLGLPLVTLLGAARDEVPVYGSGGFTSYSVARLQEQLAAGSARASRG